MLTLTRSLFLSLLLVCCFIAGSGDAFAHCQMPCGIYDDDARIQQMREDAGTIRKAMAEMRKQHAAGTLEGFNQAARWVTVKESHAQNIQDIASAYFLTQPRQSCPCRRVRACHLPCSVAGLPHSARDCYEVQATD